MSLLFLSQYVEREMDSNVHIISYMPELRVKGYLRKQWVVHMLGRYTLSDLQSTIQDEWEGQIYTYTRGWVIWHVIEHDIHHGGEIAYSLGMHGLTAPDI